MLEKMLTLNFETVLDNVAGAFDHLNTFLKDGRIVDAVDYGESVYYEPENTDGIRHVYIEDLNNLIPVYL